jgi:hypothetical protein
MRIASIILPVLLTTSVLAQALASQPVGKLPHIEVDAKNKRVRVECEALHVVAPLEFFCCVNGTNEHESVLRSKVKPSHLHLALLMIGLEPGKPASYSEAAKKWTPPHGPPINITCEFEKDGKVHRVPAYRLMRDIKTKKEMSPLTWIFVGSKTMEDGVYAADATGYLVSIVNFDLTVIDVPQVASSANETLEWEINPDLMPEKGAKVTMIIEPAGTTTAPTTMSIDPSMPPSNHAPNNATATSTAPISPVHIDEQKVDSLKGRWMHDVAPREQALREAAQAHYEVVNALRREQQRLIDEADRIQRTIDELEKQYQQMTTPRPEPVK